MGRRYGGLFAKIAIIVMLALAPAMANGCIGTGAARGIAGVSGNKAYYGE